MVRLKLTFERSVYITANASVARGAEIRAWIARIEEDGAEEDSRA